ncbi:MAG: hypothetical protein HFJ28_01250 [Clostridia bacterium]|nr:hypothetical protein [Clostridia bacterium]
MKKNSLSRIILRHVIAIALICLGVYFLYTCSNQELPFGITLYEGNIIFAIWELTGWFIATLLILIGGYMLIWHHFEHSNNTLK